MANLEKGKEDYHSPSRGSRSDPSDSEEDPENDHFWDDLDVGLPEVLPSELIGWIMLRKSSLNAAQRLNVLSSIGNSLKADDIEKGLRGAEDELRVVEKEREGRPKGHGKGKTRPQFWVEYEGEWGLMLTGECEDEDLLENDIHWLGGMSYDQVFQTSTWESSSTSRPEIEETFAADDGTCGGTWKPMASTITRMPVERFWSWSEADVWNSVLWSSPEESKPIVEAYAAYEEKIRSFQDSRRATHAKNASRGFFPKGKFKGKPSFWKERWKRKRAWFETFIIDFAYGIFTGDGHPRWRKAGIPWLPRLLHLWSKKIMTTARVLVGHGAAKVARCSW